MPTEKYNPEIAISNILLQKIFEQDSTLSTPAIVVNIFTQLISKNPSKEQAETFKGIIPKFVLEFIGNLEKVRFRTINRFVDFLAFYIHRMDYAFNWDLVKNLPSGKSSNWTEVTEEDVKKPQENPTKIKHKYLLKYLIAELQQLSYAAKMQEILPKDLYEYIQPENSVPFKYSSPEQLGYSDAQIILDRIKEKITGEQLAALLSSKSTQIEAEGELLFDIIVRCILSLAQYFKINNKK